jgi:tetratricopeptide (TPR) repeat protein
VEGRPELTGWEALRRARTGAGTFDDAVTILAAEIDEHPRDGNRREWLATALLRAHRAEESVAASEAGITLDPERPRLYLLRSEALSALGRHEDARAAAERSVGLDPECADGWLRLAAACRECDDDEAALAALDRADELGPQRAQSACLRALIHIRNECWLDARLDLERAVVLDPSNTRARALLAQAFVAAHKYRAALAAAERALERDPDHALARTAAVSAAAGALSFRAGALGVGRAARRTVTLLVAPALIALASYSLQVAALTLLVLLVPVVAFARVRYLQLPMRIRAVWNEQVDALVHGRSAVTAPARTPNRWTWRVGNVAVVAYLYAIAIALGGAFGRPLIAAAASTAVLAVLGAGIAIAGLRRTPRAERAAQRHARRAMAAHARGDFASQWVRAQRLVACAPDLPQVRRIFVHALAHQDADAAMMPLDALLIDPPEDDKARTSIACATNEVSWALLQRGEVAEALVWAKRAVDLVPDGRRALYALCLAENHEYNAARRELDTIEDEDGGGPPRLRAAFLRWRALAEARLSNGAAATEALQEARELDPTAYDFRFVADRVRDLLEAP